MKKILIILLSSILLTGCSTKTNIEEDLKVHDNIREEIVNDSYEAMRIVERYVATEEKENMDVLLDYEYKYKDDEDLTIEEDQLVSLTEVLIANTENFIKDTDIPLDFKAYKKAWYDTLETGVIKTIENGLRVIE